MVQVNPGFHRQENFSENYPQFEHDLSKIFANIKNMCFKGSQIIILHQDSNYYIAPGHPHVPGCSW
jgi:hypothetical protein